jgi:hypothetical protein
MQSSISISLRNHWDPGSGAEHTGYRSSLCLLFHSASHLCPKDFCVLGCKPWSPHGEEEASGSSFIFCQTSRAGFLSLQVLANSKDSTLGPLICLSFLRHKWPILSAIELYLKNVKCIWKLHIFADAWVLSWATSMTHCWEAQLGHQKWFLGTHTAGSEEESSCNS